MSFLELDSFNVFDGDGLRLSLSLTSGVILNRTVNAIQFIADNNTNPPFQFLFKRSELNAKIDASGNLELVILGLPLGHEYGFILLEHSSDGTENTVSNQSGSDMKFVLADAPAPPVIQFVGNPVLTKGINPDKVKLESFEVKVRFPSHNGGMKLEDLTYFIKVNTVITKTTETIDENDRKKGYKTVQITPSAEFSEGDKYSIFATIGNAVKESPFSNKLEVDISIKPSPPFDLIATSRSLDDNGNTEIPVEFKVSPADVQNWNYFSILVFDSGTENYLKTDIFNVERPLDLFNSDSVNATVTQVHNGSGLGGLDSYENYDLKVVLSREVLTENSGIVTLTDAGISYSPDEELKAFTTADSDNVELTFDADNNEKIFEETNGDLSGMIRVVPNATDEFVGGNPVRISFKITKKGFTHTLFTSTRELPNIDAFTISFPRFVKAGNWNVNDDFVISVIKYMVLPSSEIAYNVSPPLVSPPNIILATSTFEFKPPQTQNLPIVELSELLPVTVNMGSDLQSALQAMWVSPIAPAATVLNSFELQMSDYDDVNGVFAIGPSNATIKTVAAGAGETDIPEHVIQQRYDGQTGSPRALGVAGNSVYARIRAKFVQNTEVLTSEWSNWKRYEIPSDNLPGVGNDSALEVSLGNLEVEFNAPTDGFDGYAISGFELKYYRENGSLLTIVSKQYTTSVTNYTHNIEIAVNELDQYITPTVITKYTNNTSGNSMNGSAVNISKVFMHKQIAIKSAEVVINNVAKTAKINIKLDNGRSTLSPQLITVFPHGNGGNAQMSVTLSDGGNGVYSSSDLGLISELDYSKVQAIVMAANTVSPVVLFPKIVFLSLS